MDGHRFDDLTRKLAAGTSRRVALKGLLVGAAGALGWRQEVDAVTQSQCGNMLCIADPTVCREGCGCCVFKNGNNRCMPPDLCIRLGGELPCPEGQLFDPEQGGCVVDCTAAPAGTQCDTGEVCSGDTCEGNGVCTTGDLSNFGCGGAGCGTFQNACITDTEGAFICVGSINCDNATLCPNGSSDCPAGFACLPGGCGENSCQPICTGTAGLTVRTATTVSGDFNLGN